MPAREHLISLPARYRVVRHVANGGMASVWAAEDELLGRLVAVKVLAEAYAADDRARRRFKREARAGARLSDHPHVVTVYDIGEHDDRAFMVMEYLAGGTVADRLGGGDPLPRRLAIEWLRQAAEALDYAHAQDVVHRDVKPANLLLDDRGRLAVGDFGIATVATETSVTQTGQVLGTAAYISPEQALGRPATAASDRYALAVVAYELLTGHRPFPAATGLAAQARAHVEEEAPSASAVAPLPAAVDRVIEQGLAKDPAARPARATAFVRSLEDALRERPTPAAAPPIAPTTPMSSPPTVERRRWPAVAAIAAIALVIGAVVAIAAAGGGGGGSGVASTPKVTSTSAHRSQTQHRPPKKTTTTQQAPAAPQTQTQTQAQPATASPTTLNDQGYALLQQGRFGEAVPLLQQSVEGFRRQGATGDVNYAYALFNLGTALRQSGHPAEAIPYLQERLRISSFKTGAVKRELQVAQQEAGVAPSRGTAPQEQHGKKKDKGGGD